MKKTTTPEHIVFVLNRLASEGHESYLVGGCVRDTVMNRPVNDWDLATSATPVDVARLFPKTVQTGEKFGTVTIVLPEGTVEATTFRTEGEYINGRRPENVEFISNINEDLSQRDFTINAMAESADGELIDPFEGLKDIKNGVIRCVGGPNTRFSEDALRMFRAYRFSAQLGFMIETETLQAIYANTGSAERISAERIRIELEKTLMSEKPEIASEMIKIGLLDKFIAISGRTPEGLERIKKLPPEPTIRWCAFCAILLNKQHIRSATQLLHDMRFDGKTTKTCRRALTIRTFPDDKTAIKKLLSKNETIVVRSAAAINDVLNEGNALKRTDKVIASGECATLAELALTGRDLVELGHHPGPELGEKLDKLLDHVIVNPADNVRETLLKLAESLVESNDI